jgi:hypothetical protein
MAQREVPRDELTAAIEARREVGKELEPQLIEGFLERVGAAIDERVDQRLAKTAPRESGPGQIGLAVISLLFAIPLTGIAAGTTGLAGLLVVWVAIVLVNLAYAFKR